MEGRQHGEPHKLRINEPLPDSEIHGCGIQNIRRMK